MQAKIGVIIIGGSGYGGGELLRLLLSHQHIHVAGITSQSFVGQSVEAAHPQLSGFYEGLTFSEFAPLEKLQEFQKRVVFVALPHGASGKIISKIHSDCERLQIKIIDLSGDLRLRDINLHKMYYSSSVENQALRGNATYGLPELNREALAASRLVANPGCLATAAILAVLPITASGYQGNIAFDMKTGSSGSGNDPKEGTHHPNRHSNFWAYKALTHQHEPEVQQALGYPDSQKITTSFLTQSMSIVRGIFASAHLTLAKETSTGEIKDLFQSFYKSSPFVRIVDDSPQVQNVVGSNFCEIAIVIRGRQLITMAAIDNLVKGMSGQALQNMNLMFGLPETTGLWQPGLRPI